MKTSWLVRIGLMLILACGPLSCVAPTAAPREVAQSPAPPTARAISPSAGMLTFTTWNVRGYPEKDSTCTTCLHRQLRRFGTDVLCLEEIGNAADITSFCAMDKVLVRSAFTDSPDGMDNAILTTTGVSLQDLPDPAGFQHPAQRAFVSCRGFDAVVICIHLSWTDKAAREREKAALRSVVADSLRTDPDVMVVGDFNLQEPEVRALATELGMSVLLPKNPPPIGTTHSGKRYDWYQWKAE